MQKILGFSALQKCYKTFSIILVTAEFHNCTCIHNHSRIFRQKKLRGKRIMGIYKNHGLIFGHDSKFWKPFSHSFCCRIKTSVNFWKLFYLKFLLGLKKRIKAQKIFSRKIRICKRNFVNLLELRHQTPVFFWKKINVIQKTYRRYRKNRKILLAKRTRHSGIIFYMRRCKFFKQRKRIRQST